MKFNKSSVDSMSVPWIESDFAKEILKTQKVSNKLRDQANFFINNGYLILRNVLSKKIINEVMNLDIGSYTKPINAGGASMILKVNDIKEVSLKDINKELEFEKIVTTEKNRQLNEFSVIHFKKTESKSYVKKF